MERLPLIAVVLLLAALALPSRLAAYELTLPPVTIETTYTPGGTPSFARSIVLPCGPTGFIVAPPTLSNSLFYQIGGSPIDFNNPPWGTLTDDQGRVCPLGNL